MSFKKDLIIFYQNKLKFQPLIENEWTHNQIKSRAHCKFYRITIDFYFSDYHLSHYVYEETIHENNILPEFLTLAFRNVSVKT